jgi:hypothetical protein
MVTVLINEATSFTPLKVLGRYTSKQLFLKTFYAMLYIQVATA